MKSKLCLSEGLRRNTDPRCPPEPGCGRLSQPGQTTTVRGRRVMCFVTVLRLFTKKNRQKTTLRATLEASPPYLSHLSLPHLASPALHPQQPRPPSVLITHICSQSLDLREGPSSATASATLIHLPQTSTTPMPPRPTYLNPTMTLIHKNQPS